MHLRPATDSSLAQPAHQPPEQEDVPRPSVQMAKSLMPTFVQPASSSVTQAVGSIAIWPPVHWPAVRSQPAWLGALMPPGPKVKRVVLPLPPKTWRWWL